MQTCAGGATLIMKGAARLMKDASPTPTNMRKVVMDQKSKEKPHPYVFDKFAKIGDATTSPTMKADERTPS
jgi:hypothetical protein